MAKKIVILADGTGNAFTTQQSNIWRIYQALDLSSSDQVVEYIPGVGTSEFWPIAKFDGATGLGVPANVRKLHRFLSWNWEPGAEIYVFGFSRGAFTIRLLMGLVAKEGLLPTQVFVKRFSNVLRPVTHEEMRRNSMDAWRSFKSHDSDDKEKSDDLVDDKNKNKKKNKSHYSVGDKNIWVILGARHIRNVLLALWRGLWGISGYDEARRARDAQHRGPGAIPIAFAGLFDTVEAFGVPIEEMRTAIDIAIFPISFGDDRVINDTVQCVRHALSLDDERTTFHPIRIDMTEESKAAKKALRIVEAWFAGVHSDVGGGYPDDALSLVPLVWMLGEAAKVAVDPKTKVGGPKLLEGALLDFQRKASAFGPIHDSRTGLALLYRYDPRVAKGELPEMKGEPSKTKIDKKSDQDINYDPPLVHSSVIERIVCGCDNYAPVVLPGKLIVLMPDGSRFTIDPDQELEANKAYAASAEAPPTPLLAEDMANARRAVAQLKLRNREKSRQARDFVWWRRVNYFLLVVFGAALLVAPWFGGAVEKSLNDAQLGVDAGIRGGIAFAFKSLLETLKKLAPVYVEPYLDALQNSPIVFLSLTAFFIGMIWLSGVLQDKIKDLTRASWTLEADLDQGRAHRPADNGLRGFAWLAASIARGARNNSLSLAAHKSGVVAAMIIWFALLIGLPLYVSVNRVGFLYLVGSGQVCIGADDTLQLQRRVVEFRTSYEPYRAEGYSKQNEAGFQISDPCWASGWGVVRGAAYRLHIEIRKDHDLPWFDQTILSGVDGFEGDNLSLAFMRLFRRWLSAPWLHPIARIGARGEVEWPLEAVDGAAETKDGEQCFYPLKRYGDTPQHREYCAVHPLEASCLRAGLGLDRSQPLPRSEWDSAKAAWWTPTPAVDGKGDVVASCPRFERNPHFVSEFVAQETGELFLFVNDAAGLALSGATQTYYENNSGTATITLERLSPPPAPQVAKFDPASKPLAQKP